MGYFPNGATADRYREQWCEKCLHWSDNDSPDECPVWLFHVDCGAKDALRRQEGWLLDCFIPRKGAANERCTMFVRRLPQDG